MLIIALLAAYGSAVPPAAAQEAGNETATPAPDVPDGVNIDMDTVLVSSSFNQGTETATVQIWSRTDQSIELTDIGGYFDGGRVVADDRRLAAGETSTLEIDATQFEGIVGVHVRTASGSGHSEIIERGGGGLEILRSLSVMQAWIAGITIAFIWMIIAAWQELRGEKGRPERA